MDSRDLSLPPAERATDPLSTGDGDRADPGAPLARPGDVLLGKYRVEGVIGEGGMGVVVAAMHLQLKTRVALKLVRPDRAGGASGGARLLREAQAAARIRSEHVARVMDVCVLPSGAPCIVMEHLEGQDLGEVIRARGALPIEEAVGHVLQACEALAEAHAAGVVHRDIKPSNLFLTRRADGSPLVKVLDFGIAKAHDEDGDEATLTASRAVLGSPVYMSPEQIRSAKDVDHRADVWALGIVLHELLTGKAPFRGDSLSARIAAIVGDQPISVGSVRPDAPRKLSAAILRCLEKDRALRIQSVEELALALVPFGPRDEAAAIARVEPAITAAAKEPAAVEKAAPRRAPRALGSIVVAGVALAVGMLLARRSPGPEPMGEAASAAPIVSGAPSATLASTAAASVSPPASSEPPALDGGPSVAPLASSRRIEKPRPTQSSSIDAPPPRPTSSGKGVDVESATAHRK